MKSKGLLWLTVMILSTLTTSPSFAILISQNSQYGNDSITLDTDTGLRWLDPFLGFVSYNDVKSMMGTGGYYEGFRYATEKEVHSLLFSSLGIDPNTAASSNTSTTNDSNLIAHLISFFDSTFGDGDDDYYWKILDAFFESDDYNSPRQAVVSYNHFFGEHSDGQIYFLEPNPDSLAHNSNPYGHFLVREAATSVNEPSSFLIVALGLLALLRLRRRIC